MPDEVQLYTDDEYESIIASASDDVSDADVMRLIEYCDITRVRQSRVHLIIMGHLEVIGIMDDGTPECVPYNRKKEEQNA